MKQATQRQSNTKLLSANLNHTLREVAIIVMIVVGVYFTLSLITYHHSDPGWSSTGTVGFVANGGGRIGAWLSDVFLYIFGYLAYLFPLILFFSTGMIYFNPNRERLVDWRHVLLRFIGFLFVLFSSCGLAGLYFSHIRFKLPFHAGGVFGEFVTVHLVGMFNSLGATLLLTAFLLVGVTLFVSFSWLSLLEHFGRGVFSFIRLFAHTFSALRLKMVSQFSKKNRIDLWKRSDISLEPVKPSVLSESKKSVEKKEGVVIHKMKKRAKATGVVSVEGLPSLELLDHSPVIKQQFCSQSNLEDLSRSVEMHLSHFGIEGKVVAVHPGPVITRFELQLAPGVKVSKITPLVKDLARALSVNSVRVVEVIPGKSVIGLEIPNEYREIVQLREVFESKQFVDLHSPLSLALGKDIAGYPVVVDLAKMPHLLVSGTTGSGKSVSLNSMILSMLYKATPEQLRVILVDPKMLELSVYEGIPHLLTPVVTDMKEAANAFRWCVAEMDRRYKLMASFGVRNLAAYNKKVKQAIAGGAPLLDPFAVENGAEEGATLEPLPCICLIVDELADMMMVVGKKVEELIARIAQKARAAGIHMILATQRPSVDVITGLIKANIPTRIAFQVSSRVDSRTILDQQGAEQLLGYGDMLYLPPGTAHPIRIHGAFVSDDETHRVVADLKNRGNPDYLEEVTQDDFENGGSFLGEEEGEGEQDLLYDQAVRIVTETRRASISYVQRRLKIGYNRAARLLEEMEKTGVVSAMEGNGTREVLAPPPPED